jgi:acetylornithine deacetylase
VSELSELLSELVRIDSVNPDVVPGGAGELEVAHFVASWCERAGLEVELEEIAPGRANVVAVARGSGGGRSLLLNGHIDTVGVEAMENGHEPVVEGNRLYGRGAYDMKGSVAAMMIAAREASKRGLRGDVIVTAVADEEYASIGTEAVAANIVADGAIVTEPTELDVAVAHKGFAGFEIETRGRAAHGSRPDLGDDAIVKMGPILTALGELSDNLLAQPSHPLLGSGSIHASLIVGGQEFSSYPERCLLTGERRTLPGESREDVEAELRALVDGNAELRFSVSRQPFEIAPDDELVRLVHRHAGTDVIGVPFWTDAALLAGGGIPTVLFGPAGEGAHAAVEWVDLDSVERCADVLLAVAAELCA